MSKSIYVPLDQVNFPTSCVVYLSPGSKAIPIRQVYMLGNNSHTVALNVPMCAIHHEAASQKGIAERAIVGLGMFVLAWWIIADQLAPLFAVSTAKEARSAVRITLVQPFDKRIVLDFRNEAMADLVAKMNWERRKACWRGKSFCFSIPLL